MTYTCMDADFNHGILRMVGRTFLGRYETVRLLGEGGMGRVYLAKQIDLGRQVVVKVMHDHITNDPNFRKRFERETLLMARFQHPYVITLYDASLNDPEGPCIVMEYIRGVTLDTLLQRNNRLGAPRIARLLGQLCEALFAAHQEGIIHRDLKPANLMVVDADSPYEKIKVMDFGLAKLVNASPTRQGLRSSVTNSDFAVGTPGYISPEQVRGADVDHRSDLYSVGVILFELLTGRLPFTGAETMDVLLAHATLPPPSFAEVGASVWVPPAIESVVQRCLAKDPNDRPSTARELAEMYDAALAVDAHAHESVPQPYVATAPPRSEPQATPPPQPSPVDPDHDPRMIVHHVEAWMPETIASYKLRGFVDDVGGEVVESVPGKIRVRLGGKGSVYFVRGNGPLGWLGMANRNTLIDMELQLERHASQPSLLRITVRMHSPSSKAALSEAFRERCAQVFCDLRAYLMGQGVGVG
jgi:eukaryotic-like serine/threonine-protein kinase